MCRRSPPPPPRQKIQSTLKPDVPAAPAFSFDDWEAEYTEFNAEFGPGMQTTGPQKLRESDDPHGQWARLDRKDFLDEVLWHDGCGDYIDQGTACMQACRFIGSKSVEPTQRTNARLMARSSVGKRLVPAVHPQIIGCADPAGPLSGRGCPNPSTAAGNDFVVITTQGIEECSPYKFYHSLVHETDKTGIGAIVGIWDQLAVGHGTGAPPDVLSEEKDPGLYMAHLEKHWDQKQERSTCVSHDAVDKPLGSPGTASSGIGTVDCAPHNMKTPEWVGDLQMGERYLNMDYLFFMSLAGCILLQLFISYDIACQWYKISGSALWGSWCPKFHLPAHIKSCNLLFSFNLTPFVGWTDREAPEHGWADTKPPREQHQSIRPGARRDTLEVHFQYWNEESHVTGCEFLFSWHDPMLTDLSTAVEEKRRKEGQEAVWHCLEAHTGGFGHAYTHIYTSGRIHVGFPSGVRQRIRSILPHLVIGAGFKPKS
ncbi:hypothetical protein B0H14DRAFT_2585823 [Mycena olivaceomarginata]|nr:hypothetical protein B0H14DRAFT_2585823 [Mycena olivaceomarginata]